MNAGGGSGGHLGGNSTPFSGVCGAALSGAEGRGTCASDSPAKTSVKVRTKSAQLIELVRRDLPADVNGMFLPVEIDQITLYRTPSASGQA
jgi:hypothetical protein